MNVAKVLDAKNLACPMPLVKTKKAMNELQTGDILEIHATDKGLKSDLTAWAKSGSHALLKDLQDGDVLKFWVQKG